MPHFLFIVRLIIAIASSISANDKSELREFVMQWKQDHAVYDKLITEKKKADISYSMVKSIIHSITSIAIEHAENSSIKNIGLTGGVSYNIPITEMIEKQVKNAGLKFTVHNRVPNGDGCIAIGQNAIVGYKDY